MRRFTSVLVLLFASAVAAAPVTELPPAQKAGGMPLMDALAKRATSRAFDPVKEIPAQDLANLLWAAFGVNRTDGRRTAPSARNFRETDIYVLTRAGVFVYDAPGHRLQRISEEDVRALGGMQPFVKDAPVTLVYVADLTRMGTGPKEDRMLMAHLDVGFVAENASLYCASVGLATGVRAMIDRAALAPKLQLRESQVIVLAQSVGYPKS